MNLSPNFSLRELCKSQTATRKGLNNVPDASWEKPIVENLVELAGNILQPIRENYNIPFTPSSGYRSPALNDAIGGSKTSQHSLGQAVDIEVPTVDNATLAQWIIDNLIFDQLILEFYKKGEPNSGWVHVSYKNEGNRKEILTFDGKSYQKGLLT
tara:strand:+ start:1130 stop:1594 length:465 start_codon:yes stop_codon:yes gene_type:complete